MSGPDTAAGPVNRAPTTRRDGRRSGIVLTLLLVAFGGALIHSLGTTTPAAPPAPAVMPPDPHRQPEAHADAARASEVRRRFDAAVVMLHARRYDEAATALHRVLELAPQMPEAHVNMGFALLGLERPRAARDFFDSATSLKADQANAYYGLALSYEALGDLPMAMGAMRSYLHLARSEDENHLRCARSALWEWESALAAQGGAR